MAHPTKLRIIMSGDPLNSFQLRKPFSRKSATDDSAIRQTDNDALQSKYSAFKAGYLDDEYLEVLVAGLQEQNAVSRDFYQPKLPLINRGTYVRYYAIERVLECFLQSGAGDKQIVSLGAGSDSRAFSVLDQHSNVVYHEIDFPESTRKKAALIRRNDKLAAVIGHETRSSDVEIQTSKYHLHAKDLRTLNPSLPPLEGLALDIPTLVISECCLCYMDPARSSDVLNYFTLLVEAPLCTVLYEPVPGTDSFGQVMTMNLAKRGVSRSSLVDLPTIKTQESRLEAVGFTNCYGASILYIHDHWLTEENLHRIGRLQILDEREELDLLLGHYALIAGSRGFSSDPLTSLFAN